MNSAHHGLLCLLTFLHRPGILDVVFFGLLPSRGAAPLLLTSAGEAMARLRASLSENEDVHFDFQRNSQG